MEEYSKFLFSKCCSIAYNVQQQQMIINGQAHVQEIKTPVLCCPECHTVIAQLQPNTPEAELANICMQQLQGRINYCSSCGQKLTFPKWFLLDSSQYENKTEST